MLEPSVILVVDDEPAVRDYACHVLRDAGFLVAAAADAADAIEILEHIVVDVLFTDIVMPGAMNGLQLAAVARRLQPAIQIVCTSGYARPANAGDFDFCKRLLPKPYRPDQLRGEVKTALAA